MKQTQKIGRINLPMHWYADDNIALAVSTIDLKTIETRANILDNSVDVIGLSPFFEEVEIASVVKDYRLTCETDDGRRIKSVTVEVVK